MDNRIIHLYRPRAVGGVAGEYIGSAGVKYTQRTKTERSDGSVEMRERAFVTLSDYAVADNGRDAVAHALTDEFRATCGCPHDCCGHWWGGLTQLLWITDRSVEVEAVYMPNY